MGEISLSVQSNLSLRREIIGTGTELGDSVPVPIISRLRERERGLIVQIVIFLPSSEVAVGRVEKNGAEKVFRPLDDRPKASELK